MSPLFFLHGLGGGHAIWDPQVQHFTARGWGCVPWDQPGYGAAPSVEPYDFERVSGALLAQLREPAVLIGHSMGGMVAQEAYARAPERVKALVLAFTTPAFAGGGSDFARQFIAQRTGQLDAGRTMAEVAANLMPTMRGPKSDPRGLEHAQRVMSGIPPATYRKAVALLTTFDRRENLANIRVPTLLVAGSEDRVAPAAILEKMAKRIPGAEYVLLEGCGHLGPVDQPGDFNQTVEAFLRRHSL